MEEQNFYRNYSDAQDFIVCLQREVDEAIGSLAENQRLDLEVILSDGTAILVERLRSRHPNMIIVHGKRISDNADVVVLVHPTNVQVLLSKASVDVGSKAKIGFHISSDSK